MSASRTIIAVLCMALLAGCVHRAPALIDDRTAVVSGRETLGSTPDDAVQTDLVLAAKIAVDHGFRYFRIVSTRDPFATVGVSEIRPGLDLTVKFFRDGETNARTPGIFDAQDVLTTGAPAAHANAQPHVPSPAKTPATGAPRCTAYGCDW